MRAMTFALLCFAVPAAAQQRADSIALGCQRAAIADVQITQLRADTVRVLPDRVVERSDSTGTTVEGEGRFYDGERRAWRSFVFDCAYDPVRRRGYGKVTLDRVRVDPDTSGAQRGTRPRV